MDASSKACKSKCDRTHYYSLGSVMKGVIWSEREEKGREVLRVGGLIRRRRGQKRQGRDSNLKT